MTQCHDNYDMKGEKIGERGPCDCHCQAYCVLGEVDDSYKNHTIWIEEASNSRKESRVYRVKCSGEPIPSSYRPTILHLFDALVESTVGKTNLDLNKNITIDLLIKNDKTKEDVVAQWRDINGFIVSDKHRFEEVQVVGKMVLRGGLVCGYALVCKNRVLLCYADDEESFKQLISSVAEDIDDDQCKMFLRFESHAATQRIIENATERKEVMRLHTRTNLNGIKWSLIYCSNNGLHIF
ncbi:hypothetical protein OSTOST_00399 [Ostertagia ostertagi]